MMDKTILEMIAQASYGSQEAFEQLCDWKRKDILYVSLRLLGDRQDAEDATQEVLLYMQEHIQELEHPKAFNVWLYRIINGTCIKMRKKWKKNEEIEMEEEFYEDATEFLPQEFVENGERRQMILELLDELPHRQKTSMLLYYYERMTYGEISEVLHISYKEVANALMLAKRKIYKRLEKDPKMKKYLKNMYTLAPVPVLTQIFRSDMQEALGLGQTIGVAAGAAGSDVLKAGKRGVKEIMKSSARSVGMTVGAAAAAGTVIYGAVKLGKDEEPQELVVVTEQEEPVQMEELVSEEQISVEEPEIYQLVETLEDMIGIEEAEQLRIYAATESIFTEEIKNFLLNIEITEKESQWDQEEGLEYGMYVQEQDDKKLAVILRNQLGEGTSDIAFQFLNIEDELPENIEIVIDYELWREGQEVYDEE